MLLPIRTNILPRRTPYANYVLIIVSVAAFLLTYWPHPEAHSGGDIEILRTWAREFELVPERPQLWQFVSYAFLHGGFMHIIGNMLFLFIFGNNVNDRLGHIPYICFYLAGAIFSGVGHVLVHSTSSIPTLGASGAVAAVTGAYMVLYPQTLITVLYWLFFIGTIEIPALYFIVIKLILIDNVIVAYTPNIAYDAHLAGYAFGMLATMGILLTGLIGRDNYDFLAMMKRWNRRRRYRDVVSSGYDPFTGRTQAKPVRSKQVRTPAQKRIDREVAGLRTEIARKMAERNLSGAAELYLEVISLDSEQILPRQHLLDVANQLASDDRPGDSARAYEQFLAHYSNYEYTEEVELMLGLLYSRYLDQPAAAQKYLRSASGKLSDPGQMKMCREELAKLEDAG